MQLLLYCCLARDKSSLFGSNVFFSVWAHMEIWNYLWTDRVKWPWVWGTQYTMLNYWISYFLQICLISCIFRGLLISSKAMRPIRFWDWLRKNIQKMREINVCTIYHYGAIETPGQYKSKVFYKSTQIFNGFSSIKIEIFFQCSKKVKVSFKTFFWHVESQNWSIVFSIINDWISFSVVKGKSQKSNSEG